VFLRLRISQRQKKVAAWNFACLFDYYPGWAPPIVKVKTQRSRSTGTKNVLYIHNTLWYRWNGIRSLQISSHKQQMRRFRRCRGVRQPACERLSGQSEFGAIWWDLCLADALVYSVITLQIRVNGVRDAVMFEFSILFCAQSHWHSVNTVNACSSSKQ